VVSFLLAELLKPTRLTPLKCRGIFREIFPADWQISGETSHGDAQILVAVNGSAVLVTGSKGPGTKEDSEDYDEELLGN
jgi:hypothetical protein